MGFRCHWCHESCYTSPYACTLPCGHSICSYCYQNPPPCCVACQVKLTSEAGGGTPGQALETRFGPSAPEENGCQNPMPEREGKSGISQIVHNKKMGNSCFGPQQREKDSDIWQSGTIGKVGRLRQQFESGSTTAQEGATEWKAHNPEKDSTAMQGSTNTPGQQDTLVRMQDPQYAPLNVPSSSPPIEGQRTQHRRLHSRGTPPYPSSVPTKDAYLSNTGTRETKPCPSGTINTFPSISDRNPSPSSSTPSSSHTNPSCSPSRIREPSLNVRSHSCSFSRNRNPSASSSSSSSSIPCTNPSHSTSTTREPSPSSLNARSRPRSSPRNRDSSSSHLGDRISSPSPSRHTNHFRSSSSPRDPSRPSSRQSSPSLYTSGSRKSSPTPSEATEPSTAPSHSSGAMFPVTHSKGEHGNGATSHHAATHGPLLKQPLTPISAECLTYPRVQRFITTPTATMTRGRHLEELDQRRMEEKGLPGELMVWQEKGSNPQHEELERRQETQKSPGEGLSKEIDTLQQSAMKFEGKMNLKKEMLDVKEVEWAWLREEYDKQRKEIVELKEKDCKHQEELARFKELSLAQQNQAQEHIMTMSQEITELKEEVTALREAKDAQEKEASHWRAEYDKQRAATEEEIRQFKEQECSRLEKDYNRWALKMTEMQNKVAAREGEISQYLEKHNILQNEFQQMQEEWIRSKEEVSKLAMENAQHQQEKIKHEEEVRDLKQEMSAKRKEWRKERNLYTENIVMLEGKVDTLERENSSLRMKEQENQAALRRSKDDMTCLISERDSCQEEIEKLKQDKEMHKKNMAQLRKERDDHQMKLHALENRPLESPRLKEKISTWLLEIDKLKSKEARQQEEATQLRQERDNSKEEADQLKRREVTELTQLREERNRYKEDADQLKGRPDIYLEKANELSLREVTELQQERYSMEREIDQLKQEENTMRRERDEYKEKADNLKREVKAIENQMIVIGRERDSYKEQIDERETQYNKIIQMATERNNFKIRENEESSMIALLQQEISNYKMKIEEHKGNETELEYKIMNMKTEMENHVRDLDAQIMELQQDNGCYKEQVNEYEGSKATLKKQIKHMGMVIENQQKNMESQTAQLKQERDGYQKEAEAAKQREASLENQMKQMRDKNNHETEVVENCKREEDEYRQTVDQLMRKNYELEHQLQRMTRDKDSCKTEVDSCKREVERRIREAKLLTSKNSELEGQLNKVKYERDTYKNEKNSLEKEIDSYKRESNNHKQEIEHLKRRQYAEVTQHRQGTDQHQNQTVAERLRKQSGSGDAGPRKVTQSERGLSDFLATPTHSQHSTSGAAEVVDVVMAGPEEGATPVLREEQPGTHWLEVPATQGLPNLGNTCYISSVVQCLYHLSPLRNTLAACHQDLYQHNQSGTGVAAALAQLFGAMQTAYEMGVHFATRELKNVLGSYDATFNGRQQQEAHDLFTALVSCLQSDLSQHSSLDQLSRASSLFDGQLETSMVCLETGAPLTHTTEAFTSLSLPVVEAREWFLKDLLDKHFRVQEMDWDCERCHFTHKCFHSTRIRRCPPLLVIHFSRVANYNSTRKVKVNFPVAQLNLQPYIAPDAPRSPQYRLVGVVCHEGSMAYGHYTAYCRYGRGRRSGRWRLCNDMQLQDVKERTVLEDESAHMLFYIQQ